MQDNQHDAERDTSLDPYRPNGSGVFYRDEDGIEAKLMASIIYDPCVDCTYISVEAVSGTWFTPVVVPWDRDKLMDQQPAKPRRFEALRRSLQEEERAGQTYDDVVERYEFVAHLADLCGRYCDTDTEQQRFEIESQLSKHLSEQNS